MLISKRFLCGGAAAMFCVASGSAAHALTFNLTDGSGLVGLQTSNPTLYAQVQNGFQQAADVWANRLTDNVTVNIIIDYQALGAGILGDTSSNKQTNSYSGVRSALAADATSAADASAVASLPAGGSISFRTDDRTGAAYLDNNGSVNNSSLVLTTANAKALGLYFGSPTDSDASITFSSGFSWDFDPSNGITGGQFDFVGVAAHEIAHVLGFESGVDTVDYFSGPNGPGKNSDLNGGQPGIGSLDNYTVLTPLDLYRFSSASLAYGAGVRDDADGGSSYFSIDGGVTNLAYFSTGQFNGATYQASHWKQNTGGILDPAVAPGSLKTVKPIDLEAMDVIGWNLSTAIPEPATAAFALLALPALVRRRR